ncbi:MAG TPA: glucoamylase family protein [Verrucomicrobiae bacterium]|nr:glucoamylase family protein [Verrucomicrobiae bacterium]
METLLNRVTEYVRARSSSNEPPLRGELFSLEQLVRHAKTLAEAHLVVTQRASNRLLARLGENEQILRAYNRATQAVDQTRRVTHAAEWLLDNFYLIEEQIQMARRHLPRGYSRELPRLQSGPSAGLPRVYDLVLELISHVDAQLDAEPLRAFITAYQTISPLKLGELWAIPIMLRLALIENLRRVTARLQVARHDRDLADLWVERLQEMAEKNPAHLVVVVADMAQSTLPLSSAFVAEFTKRLSRQSPAMHLARTWLEQSLTGQGLYIDQMVHLDSQTQAADQVSVSHTINSLRFLSALDWREFVEDMSQVDQTLRLDPAGVYGKMDFPTRDAYRHSIEAISRHSLLQESEVAQKAVQLAEGGAQQKGMQDRTAHVGFYLLGEGLVALERATEMRRPWQTALERCIRRFPLSFYAGGIFLLTALGTLGLTQQARTLDAQGWKLAFFIPVFLLCSSQLAVALMNWLSAFLVKPRLLPRLDYGFGIGLECRTMVVVPTMLSSSAAIDRLLESLEIHYLANRDPNLYFALLTDFQDAPEEFQSSDNFLLHRARTGVEMLNAKYQPDRPDIFFLFHRPRRWNKVEGLWMGYERKRGKLTEFNALLRGGSKEGFSEIIGDISILPAVKFVITLDTDTQLPRDTARRLAGTMAHPLNRPQFDPVKRVVTQGYGILQPRVGVSLPSAGRSWFVKLFAGDVGIDPYTRAVSDVYQDVFQEGSFIGKGIYDVDAFQQAVAGRFPENAVLSHDLIEACHARSALVSDVELYEEYPSRYNTDINRRHRWIRGDWQIAQWLLPRVPGPDARRIANPLSTLSQWKILDNLRRSLVPAALLLLLLGDWMLLPGFGVAGALMVFSIILLPAALSAAVDLFRKPLEVSLSLHLRGLVGSFGRQLGQAFLTFVFLPYDALISLDAIARTLVRLLITRKRLLEWQTASEAERAVRERPLGFYSTMWIAPAIGLACGTFLALAQPSALPMAAPVLGLWLACPWIAWRISQPIGPSAAPELKPRQLAFLRQTARKTWRFFETFVTEQEHWLPPDNFQEEPVPVVASRTSPTNMGLALLSNLAACDFGYLSVGQLLRRTRDALDTMQRLERHRGHFFNWYDTRTLKPLLPLYISTVDSGNLAGHLLTLGPGLAELSAQPILATQVFEGLSDTLRILHGLSGKSSELENLESALRNVPSTLRAGFDLLQQVTARAARLVAALQESADEELKWWTRSLERDCREHLKDLLFLAPWLALQPDVIAQISNLLICGSPNGAATAALEASGSPDVLNPKNRRSSKLETPGSPPEATQAACDNLRTTLAALGDGPTLLQVAHLDRSLCPLIEAALQEPSQDSKPTRKEDRAALAQWLPGLRQASQRASERILELQTLARESAELAKMDFSFLFDSERELFSVGFNVTDRRMDASFYDLLASESRLCSYVVIAQGQVSQDHWFSLGRLLVSLRGDPVLASSSGSMFEYLMPLLVMPNYDNTLLDETCKGAVRQQIKYGQSRGVPWGVSESGYNRTDVHLNYQYRAFGVPGLGLKRGLAEDLVIAPYATAMALMVAPREACDNLEQLAADGREGPYGFYEAVDYTPSRLPPGQSSVTIRSFMAHHQGMSLLGLAYQLLGRPMQRRFMACPFFRAADLLLQERVPNSTAKVLSEEFELIKSPKFGTDGESLLRLFTNPDLPAPEVQLLSNGRYHVVVSSAGSGYSRWRDLAVTRWREDATRDCWGTFIYLRDVASGEFWSAAHQPCLRSTKRCEAIFTEARAEFRQHYASLEIHTEISVSPEDDVELRRVTLTNHSHVRRTIELTSYAEVVLAPPAADASHPAFGNLFVQTEFLRSRPAVLCTRRPRSEEEKPPWLLNLLVGQSGEQGEVSCETDRSRFVGRGRSLAAPAALQGNSPLSNTTGSVLDPISALRCTVTLAPHGTARLDLVMGMAETRDAALGLVEKYHNQRMTDRALDLAWTHGQVTLRHLNASEADTQLYARLAGDLIYANPVRRASSSVLLNNRRGQNGLWGYGISGDAPIVLLRISDPSRIEIVQQLLQAHSYWRMKGLPVDLVILNEDVSVYRQPLQDQIFSLIASGIEAQMLDKPGGIFVRRLEQFSAEDRLLLQSVARLVLSDENGTLREQSERPALPDPVIPLLTPARSAARESTKPLSEPELIFNNGLGGFTRDGREYVITLSTDQVTPAPWVNVLANPHFGTVVSESGSAYTWVENSHEFRLTPWNNDPVTDTTGEAFYIRDEQTGQFWSPTPQPARGVTPYVIRHGFGYSVFEHTENGITSELSIYVAIDAPVKFAVLKLRNLSGRARALSVTGYWEWVLGELRHKNLLHVQTEVDPKSGALFVRNHFNTEFAERIAFVDVTDPARTFTGDRREFLGRNGSLSSPRALKRTRLSGKTGAGLDPCAAVQMMVDLSAGQQKEISFRLGVGRDEADVQTLIRRFRSTEACRGALEGVWQYWSRTLGAVQVETPDPSVNVLANGWLLYQTLSSRLWARTGFYQSGGAFGFRDQLQDVMALVHAEPALTREHLLRSAAHQFLEGDVQHWWHPPAGRGVRTHFSDDYLWLAYATCRYVACVADTGVLDESIPFIEGRPLKPEEESYYDLPNRSETSATLYQHCVRAIERALKFGEHGLPFMGCGDWNDGMNLVGKEGRGESVWLAFFLYDVLVKFAELARGRNDTAFAELCLAQARLLQQNIEKHAWDGQWYRRAYFDNGKPLGSSTNPECQIDSLPQSWSVISCAGDPQRSRQAMAAVDERLIRRDAGLIQLFDPPFDRSALDPGYIKGYIPGVRENGGQYTHGAIWTVMGFALLGENDQAWDLFALLNPIRHGATPGQIATYKVEPYVIAADVYAAAPHTGRGGWTWYTGSAGWMYRLLLETMLGVNLAGNHLVLTPRLPKKWDAFTIHYRYRQTHYRIRITRSSAAPPDNGRLSLDGQALEGNKISLLDDRRDHFAELQIN